ncbi:putative uncharacterized protein [Sutterella sp. CAG:351]|nr:putative uncharacterized protein [Sutterella sp. CAG:351]
MRGFHRANALFEHQSPHFGVRSRGELALFDIAVKWCAREDAELIAVRTVKPQIHHHPEVFLPGVERLIGEAVDKIHDHRGLVVARQALKLPHEFFLRGTAADSLTDLRIKGLDTEREAVRTALHAGFHPVRPEIREAAFKRNLAVVRERQILLHRADQPHDVRGFERGRRAAAEIHRLKRPSGLNVAFIPELQLPDQEIRERAAFLRVAVRLDIEETVEAARLAVRHIDIGNRPAAADCIGNFLNTDRELLLRHETRAHPGVRHDLRVKRIAKRISGNPGTPRRFFRVSSTLHHVDRHLHFHRSSCSINELRLAEQTSPRLCTRKDILRILFCQ